MVSSLSKEELEQVNETVASKTKEVLAPTSGRKRSQYNDYSAEERAKIGKYAAENGATKACRHFSKTLGRSIPEATARRLKSQYLATLNSKIQISGESNQSIIPSVQFLPKKNPGRPLLLGKFLDDSAREFIESLRKVGGVVNTAIVQAAVEGIVAAKKPSLLVKHGGHIIITKGWVKSLFSRMGYVKRKGSNAGKITVTQFNEVQEVFLADIQAEVLMNDVHPQLIFNWDQTPVHYVPTGEWTMHRQKEKIIPIANSDDKRQITAVLAVTLTGEYLPPQLIYPGKTTRCHPTISFPTSWDIFHTPNHWSNEETMKRYI